MKERVIRCKNTGALYMVLNECVSGTTVLLLLSNGVWWPRDWTVEVMN